MSKNALLILKLYLLEYSYSYSLNTSDTSLTNNHKILPNRDGTNTLVNLSDFNNSKLIQNMFFDINSDTYYFNYSATNANVYDNRLYENF